MAVATSAVEARQRNHYTEFWLSKYLIRPTERWNEVRRVDPLHSATRSPPGLMKPLPWRASTGPRHAGTHLPQILLLLVSQFPCRLHSERGLPRNITEKQVFKLAKLVFAF